MWEWEFRFWVPKTVALNFRSRKKPYMVPKNCKVPIRIARTLHVSNSSFANFAKPWVFLWLFHRRWIILPPFSWPRCCSSSMATSLKGPEVAIDATSPGNPRKFGCACNNMWTIVNISKHLWKPWFQVKWWTCKNNHGFKMFQVKWWTCPRVKYDQWTRLASSWASKTHLQVLLGHTPRHTATRHPYRTKMKSILQSMLQKCHKINRHNMEITYYIILIIYIYIHLTLLRVIYICVICAHGFPLARLPSAGRIWAQCIGAEHLEEVAVLFSS